MKPILVRKKTKDLMEEIYNFFSFMYKHPHSRREYIDVILKTYKVMHPDVVSIEIKSNTLIIEYKTAEDMQREVQDITEDQVRAEFLKEKELGVVVYEETVR